MTRQPARTAFTHQPPHARLAPAPGFTLVELLVTIAILAMLLMAAMPSVVQAIQNARASALVHRLPQDLGWARNRAATAQLPYRVLLGPNCQWQVQKAAFNNNGTLSWSTNSETAQRSLSGAAAAAQYADVSCLFDGAAEQQIIRFNNLGLVAGDTAPHISIRHSNGQSWSLQVLLSGLVLLNTGTSS